MDRNIVHVVLQNTFMATEVGICVWLGTGFLIWLGLRGRVNSVIIDITTEIITFVITCRYFSI